MNKELKDFLDRNRIDAGTWDKSGCTWDTMEAIRKDHQAQAQMLSESAALYAKIIQTIPGVHSVRWRVKDVDHLLEKIIRKKAASEEKYAAISSENYYEIVTDLIGIRALHLFKDDCFEINNKLISICVPAERPVAYIRNGDHEDLIEKYTQHGLEVKVHPAGYRSIHYVVSSQPINRKVFAEIQIRTIFEEGWSEIDHKIRYPNFSDNELVGYFLTIFNRMAGSADEMGSFVTGLAASIKDYQLQISQASKERDDSLKSIEDLLTQLAKLKQQDKESKDTVERLQEQVAKMKKEKTMSQLFSSTTSASDIFNNLLDDSSQKFWKEMQESSNVLKEMSASSSVARLLEATEYKKRR